MKQCIIIHGGEAFDTVEQYYAFLEACEVDPFAQRLKRRDWLKDALTPDWQVILPEMPCKQNATYRAWKIWFEKLFPSLGADEIVLIGYSLGGWFLCKRLSENQFPKQINQLHLVAACISADGIEGEGSADFGFDHMSLTHLGNQCDTITLYHSRDDEVVPYAQAELLKTYLPKATLHSFEDRNHFFQPTFPELLEQVRK